MHREPIVADPMKNQRRFEELIPHALRSIPYIVQTHVFKAYCALEIEACAWFELFLLGNLLRT